MQFLAIVTRIFKEGDRQIPQPMSLKFYVQNFKTYFNTSSASPSKASSFCIWVLPFISVYHSFAYTLLKVVDNIS